jgi:hypothetical protein
MYDFILQLVFEFCKDEYYPLGFVSKQWNALYKRIQKKTSTKLYFYSISHLKTIRLLMESCTMPNHRRSYMFVKNAILSNRFSIIAYLYFELKLKNVFFNSNLTTLACYVGNFNILEWMLHKKMKFNYRAYNSAIEAGSIATLNWLKEKRVPIGWIELVTVHAIECKQFKLLQWFCSNYRFQLNKWHLISALRTNSIQTALWLLEQGGIQWEPQIAAEICDTNVKLFKWVLDQGCPIDEKVCASAAFHGQLDILKLARERGCPWDVFTCKDAAMFGNTHVLKWAIEHGAMVNDDVWENAAVYGHIESLQCLLTFFPNYSNLSYLYDLAIENDCFDVASFLKTKYLLL